jgi:hypothetical protein
MSNIVIEDLEIDEELDRDAMVRIHGGHFGPDVSWIVGLHWHRPYLTIRRARDLVLHQQMRAREVGALIDRRLREGYYPPFDMTKYMYS